MVVRFREVLYPKIILSLILPLWLYFLCTMFNLEIYYKLLITLIGTGATFFYFYLYYKHIILNDEGIVVINKMKHDIVLWEKIKAMSVIIARPGAYYLLSLEDGLTFKIPVMESFKEFEELVARHTDLKVFSSSKSPNFWGPNSRTWTKNGEEYQPKGIADVFSFLGHNDSFLKFVAWGGIATIFAYYLHLYIKWG